MVTIGNDTLPGPIQEIESAASTGASLSSAAVPFIVGQGDLRNGEASANTAKKIVRSSQARTEFGAAANSMLTTAVQDALAERANPVYAVSPDIVEVTGEDLSGASGTDYTLSNSPVLEDEDSITFTINNSTKTTTFYYKGDPSNASVPSGEVYVNPTNGKVEADESMGNTGDTVDYWWADYANTFDEVTNAVFGNQEFPREVADFLVLLSEDNDLLDDVRNKSQSMEQNGWFNIALAGAGEPYLDDAETANDELLNYTNTEDTSRLQLVSPTRAANGNTLLGAWAGVKSRIGIERTPIFERFENSYTDVIQSYDRSQKEHLASENIVPLEPSSRGVKILEDMTTVQDGNVDEANWKQATARLITDFTAENVTNAVEPFYGEFNHRGTQSAVRASAGNILNRLLFQRSIDKYALEIVETSDTELVLDIGLDTADPLRNIRIKLTAGDVQGGVSIESQ